jgi:integrase
MKSEKRPRLPRGLQWRENSIHIWFSWRDARGKQHRRSTQTADPQQAAMFRLQFLQKAEEHLEELNSPRASLGKLPLKQVADLYFKQKSADHAAGTIARERRIFRRVEEYFGPSARVNSIHLWLIQQYQQERSTQISPTMKLKVTARTVNYEMQLLRGVMMYAGCWTGDLAVYYKPLRQLKSQVGKMASNDQLSKIFEIANTNAHWTLAMYCAAVAAGTGCRACEIKNLQLRDIEMEQGRIRIRPEVAKNRVGREPRLMALAEWGIRELLHRARLLGITAPEHYLLPLNLRKSRHWSKKTAQKWDPTRPRVRWVKSWRKLMVACKMPGFRFHDLRHTFRTQGAQAGVQLEVMMAQLGHMDRETSLEYVHIQQDALGNAKRLIERQQAEVLSAATGRPIDPPTLHDRNGSRSGLGGSRSLRRVLWKRKVRKIRRTESTAWR